MVRGSPGIWMIFFTNMLRRNTRPYGFCECLNPKMVPGQLRTVGGETVIPRRAKLGLRPPVYRLLLFLLSVVPLMMILSLATDDHRLIHSRFDIDGEATVPAWYSTVLLFCVAQCAFALYYLRNKTEPNARLPSFWLVFALVYCFLSLDEAARIHEMLGERMNIKWIFIYAPFAAVFFAFCCYFFIFAEAHKEVGKWVLGGLILFAAGGLGGESISYFFGSSLTEKIFEESFEMFGTIVVLVGCLQEVLRRIQADDKTRSPAPARSLMDRPK